MGDPDMIDTDRILEDAEVAAIYFRGLIDKGVQPFHAASLTSSYVSARQITRASNEEPKKPWEG